MDSDFLAAVRARHGIAQRDIPLTGPTLRTERLELKWLTLDDAPLMLAIWTDPAFVRNSLATAVCARSMKPRTALRDGALQLYSEFGYGPFRVTRLEDATDNGYLRVCFGARGWTNRT